jgi:hypothetical protein
MMLATPDHSGAREKGKDSFRLYRGFDLKFYFKE